MCRGGVAQFVSDPVPNPKARFSHDVAHIEYAFSFLFILPSRLCVLISVSTRNMSVSLFYYFHLYLFIVSWQGTVKPVLSYHIEQYIFLAFQTGGCLLLNERSAESMSFLHYFHSAISNHLVIDNSMSLE